MTSVIRANEDGKFFKPPLMRQANIFRLS